MVGAPSVGVLVCVQQRFRAHIRIRVDSHRLSILFFIDDEDYAVAARDDDAPACRSTATATNAASTALS